MYLIISRVGLPGARFPVVNMEKQKKKLNVLVTLKSNCAAELDLMLVRYVYTDVVQV